MKARRMGSVFLCSAAVIAAGVATNRGTGSATAHAAAATISEEAAQLCRDNGQPYMLIVVFSVPKGEGDSIGVFASDTVRQRVTATMCRQFFPRPKTDINAQLSGSDYDTAKALADQDVKLLASLMSADVVVLGQASYAGKQWTITPRLMDPTESLIQEPLAATKGFPRTRHAAEAAIELIKPAAAMMPQYKKCRNAVNDGKYQEGADAAKAALALYPPSVMARICLVMAYDRLKKSPDSIIAITNEILKVNPKDFFGIRFAERAERADSNIARANDLLVELLALKPDDPDLQEEVIRAFAEQKDYTRALAIVAKAKEANPGHPNIVSLEATICYATQDWPCAIKAYELLGVVDTSAMNVQYFERLGASNQKAGNLREAANAVTRGTSKFPDEVRLHTMNAQFFRELGDTTASIAAGRKALALNPAILDIYYQIASAFGPSRPDSMVATLTAALPHAKTAGDSLTISQVALAPAQPLFEEASKVADSVKTEADWTKLHTVIKLAEFSEKVVPAANSKFYIGASLFPLGLQDLKTAHGLQATDAQKTCELAKSAYERWTRADQMIQTGGGSVSREFAVAVLGAIQGNQQTLSDLRTKFCK